MKELKLRMDLSVNDLTGAPYAAYLQVREGLAAETKEVQPGKAFADYDGDGHLLGIEFLSPCSVNVLDRLVDSEPEPVAQRFIRGSMPRGLIEV